MNNQLSFYIALSVLFNKNSKRASVNKRNESLTNCLPIVLIDDVIALQFALIDLMCFQLIKRHSDFWRSFKKVAVIWFWFEVKNLRRKLLVWNTSRKHSSNIFRLDLHDRQTYLVCSFGLDKALFTLMVTFSPNEGTRKILVVNDLNLGARECLAVETHTQVFDDGS